MSTPQYVKIIATDARQLATLELAITKFSKNKFALATNHIDVELIDGDSIQGYQYISKNTFTYPYVIMTVNPSKFEHPFTIAKPLKPETLFKALTECLEKTTLSPIPITAPFSQGIQYIQYQKTAKNTQHKLISEKIEQEKPKHAQTENTKQSPETITEKQYNNEKVTPEETQQAKHAVQTETIKKKTGKQTTTDNTNNINKISKKSSVSDIRDLSFSRLISMQQKSTKEIIKPDEPIIKNSQRSTLKPAPVFIFNPQNVNNNRPMEMENTVYFGNLPEINATDLLTPNSICFFNFKQHLAYHIAHILFSRYPQAEIQHKVIAFDIDGSYIFLSMQTDICYTTLNVNSLHAFAISPFPHAPYYTLHASMNEAFNYYGKQKATNKMSAQLFLSQITLLAARGRLPIDTDLNKKISIIKQPDISKIVPIPGAIRVFSLWNMIPTSLLETCKIIGLPQKYVFSIYLIALVSGVLKNDIDTNKATSNETHPKTLNNDLNDLLNHINSL